jgi:hypothetical protein
VSLHHGVLWQQQIGSSLKLEQTEKRLAEVDELMKITSTIAFINFYMLSSFKIPPACPDVHVVQLITYLLFSNTGVNYPCSVR